MSFLKILLAITFINLLGCKITDDLSPSSTDKRGDFDSSTIGYHIGQTAPEFSVPDTLNNTFLLSAEITTTDAIVLYFTMWCPICDSHMSHMRSEIIPNYSNVKFYFVDYVSGIVIYSRSEQLNNGYGSSSVLVDDAANKYLTTLYNATMGTTIVIDRNTVMQMNEDYKGSKLQAVLDGLP